MYVVALGGPADAERQRDLDEYILERRKGIPNRMSVISMTKRDPEAALLFTQKAARLHEAHPDILGHLILRDLGPMIEKACKYSPKSKELMLGDFFAPLPVQGKRKSSLAFTEI